jgi:hypothetical protein
MVIGHYGPKLRQWLKNRFASVKAAAEAVQAQRASVVQVSMGGADSSAIREPDPEPEKDWGNVSSYFNTLPNPRIDDNPELEFNPIIEYKIRRAKEADRIAHMRRRAEEEGLDLDEVDEADLSKLGPVHYRSPLGILEASGARFLPVYDQSSAADTATREARRRTKAIETYLTKYESISLNPIHQAGLKTMLMRKSRTPGPQKIWSVYEKAMDTLVNPHGGVRSERTLISARSARLQLKEIQRRNPGISPLQEAERSTSIERDSVLDTRAARMKARQSMMQDIHAFVARRSSSSFVEDDNDDWAGGRADDEVDRV